MTFFRASFGIITRTPSVSKSGKAGSPGSALRRSAYQRCTDEDEHKFSDKADELHSAGLMLPEGAKSFDGPQSLWEAAEAMEKRVDAQLARTLEIAIPHEVPEELRGEFREHMLSWLVEDHGFAVEWSRHVADHVFDDGTMRDTKNDHIHALISLRSLGADGFNPLKDRNFNSLMRKRNGREMREFIADRMNGFFDQHGIQAKVTADPKSQDAFRIEEAPKHIIQEIKRTKKQEHNNGLVQPKSTRAREFIRQRHSRKNTIRNARNAYAEHNEAQRELRAHTGSKEPDSSRNSADDIKRDLTEARPKPSDDRSRETDSQRAPERPGTASDTNRREKRGVGRGTVEGSPGRSDEPGRADRKTAVVAGNNPRETGKYRVDLQSCRRAIRNGKLQNAARQAKGFKSELADIAGATMPASPPPAASTISVTNMDAASFLAAWAAQQEQNRYKGA